VAGLPLYACGELATLLAAETITHLGVKLSAEVIEAARAMSARSGSEIASSSPAAGAD